MQEDIEESPSNIIPALQRYKWHLIVSIPLILVVCTFVILALPPVYKAEGRIMVETQQIPQDLVRSTVTSAASEQIGVIQQRVMTRANLLDIISKYDYFTNDNASPAQINQLLADFSSHIGVDIESARRGREAVAIGFRVSFSSPSPSVAQAVANDLVTLFLSENVKSRTKRASETTAFLNSEAKKIRKELNEIEAQVVQFKQENKDTLPEHLDLYVDMLDSSREQVSNLSREVLSYKEQLNTLDNQLRTLRDEGTVVDDISQQNIGQLREEYRRLLLIYQPSHPDLVALRERINILEQGGANSGDQNNGLSDAEVALNNQILTIKAQIDIAEANRQQELEEIADLEQRIVKIPQVEQGFTEISRDYQSKIAQYNSIIARVQDAEMAESLEQERKAERFSVLESPVYPTSPSEPDRKKLMILAFAFAFGLPVGLVLAIGFLDKSIRGSDALELITGAPPLIEIPYIETKTEAMKKRKAIMIGILVGLGLLLVSLLIVHLLVAPIDEVLSKITVRFGA